jgi:hypothetical protein
MARRLVFDPTAGQAFVDQWQRYDYRLFQNGFVHRVDDTQGLSKAAALLADLGYLVHQTDASSWRTEHDLHDALAETMSFPDYYGRNLDALNDVLRDVAAFEYGSTPTATGTALLINSYDRVSEISPRLAYLVVDIFARQAQHAALLGHPMLCIVTTTAELGTVGAVGVSRHTPLAEG